MPRVGLLRPASLSRPLAAIALLGGTIYLFFGMPTGFIPSQDSGFAFGVTLASLGLGWLGEPFIAHRLAPVTPITRLVFAGADRIRRRAMIESREVLGFGV